MHVEFTEPEKELIKDALNASNISGKMSDGDILIERLNAYKSIMEKLSAA